MSLGQYVRLVRVGLPVSYTADISAALDGELKRGKGASAVMRYYEPDSKRLIKSGVVTIDDTDLVIEMTEKSPTPATHWCCPPFYFYTREDAKLVKRGIEEGCGTDAPGSYIAWLCKRARVYAMEMPGKRYDIGNLESYEQVKKEYKGIC